MGCPNCGYRNIGPRRCPNCGHRFEHDSALAREIDLRSKRALELLPPPDLLPRPPVPRNIVEFSTGKAVQS